MVKGRNPAISGCVLRGKAAFSNSSPHLEVSSDWPGRTGRNGLGRNLYLEQSQAELRQGLADVNVRGVFLQRTVVVQSNAAVAGFFPAPSASRLAL